MDSTYLILIVDGNEISVKGYFSFARLCSDNGIKKGSIDKKKLPVKIGNKTILSIVVDTKI
jgi:hypothetical protein